jgi:uncharacterized protein (TIGR02099 family)
MPAKRARSHGSRAGLLLARAGRFAGIVAVTGFGLFALALLAVRFVVFPQVERYRDALADALSAQLDRPVEIAVLATGWDGWNPKLVVEGLRVRDRGRAAAAPLIELPAVELVVSWTSLPLLDLRLKELVIERPRLAIRRDRAGMLHVAGFEFDPAQAGEDRTLTDWLLRQRHIVVRDALILWNDDLRNAPQLVLDRVQFRMQNRLGRHRFGLTGAPPPEIAAPIDVRGDLRGLAGGDWQHARGSLYVRLDYADVAAWREWLPLPIPLASGKGALRLWLDLADAAHREIVVDLELAQVSTQLGSDLPRLELPHLSGRVGIRDDPGRDEISARGVAFATAEGQRLGPLDLTLRLTEATESREASGQLDFDRLELAPLREIAAHLPLADDIRAHLVRLAPRGTLTRGHAEWRGPPDAPMAYAAAASFADIGTSPYAAIPGASGISGRVEATQEKGELRIASRNAVIAAPRLFAEPVALDTLDVVVAWEHKPDGTTVRAQRIEFAGAGLSGSAAGSLRVSGSAAGHVDASAEVARIDAASLHRYVPLGAKEGLRSWLHTAFVRGTLGDLRVRLVGPLADLPFAAGKRGQFLVTGKAKDVLLDYAPHWPAVDGIDADIRVDGARLTIDAAHARVYGAVVGRTRAEIADLAAEHPLLRIDGTASGPTADFLRFVAESPVAEWIERLTDGAEAGGEGRLALHLRLPLGHSAGNHVAGEFTFIDGELRLPHVPQLRKLNGTLAFSGAEVSAQSISAETLGGPTSVALSSRDGRVRVSASGSAPVAQVRREYPLPHGERLAGTIAYSFGVEVRPELSWVLESTLEGVAVDLPPPLGKPASERMPLRVERRGEHARPGQDTIVATYGRVATFTAHRREQPAGAAIERALLSIGRAADRPDARRTERAGLWLRGDLTTLDVDRWLTFLRHDKASVAIGAAGEPTFSGADLRVDTLDAFGARFVDLDVAARRTADGWNLELGGASLAGNATWSEPGPATPSGRIVARLRRFAVPAKGNLPARVSREAAGPVADAGGGGAPDATWPELDIVAESVASKGNDLGSLELRARPRGDEWRIERLALANDAGRIEASGEWRVSGRQQQTRLDIVLDAADAGSFAERFGYPDTLDGAPTKIRGQLAWAGTPAALDFPTLSGHFHIDVGAGRFSKVEPGIGKLLGVLSLQALPRRMTLDFRDIFSEGFSFDQVSGDVLIANGVMSTRDLRLVGPAAQVDISGEADLARETQRLAVRVQPSLSGSVSAGAALLFFANPLLGAMVGAGSLLAQKMLKDPIEQIFSYEYSVTGSWSDPVVTRSGSATTSVAPGAPPAAPAVAAPSGEPEAVAGPEARAGTGTTAPAAEGSAR